MSHGTRSYMTPAQQREILDIYAQTHPDLQLMISAEGGLPPGWSHLHDSVMLHDYVVLDGRRITPSTFNGPAPDSLIQIQYSGRRWVGEIVVLVTHLQPIDNRRTARQHLAGVRWLKPHETMDTSPWDP